MDIERLTKENFNSCSRDNFIRHQVVRECWRNVDGHWVLLPIEFVEDWDLNKCREEVSAIANNLHVNMVDYGAFEGAQLLGYVTVGTEKKESQAAYKALGCVHAVEIIQGITDEEPCDVQLEYVL